MSKLICLRHGESMWNKNNLFTGWVDVPLSEKGVQEALKAGELLKEMPIDVIFTSTLIRGIMTAMLVMSVHREGRTPVVMHEEGKLKEWSTIYSEATRESIIPVIMNDALNERMYGELQGLNKDETRKQFGTEQVQIWRRSYDISPPYGESLKDTTDRTIPFFKSVILPYLQHGKNVLIAAHGNSLRACTKYIEGLSNDEVVSLEIATGVPIVYTCKEQNNEMRFSKS